MTNQKFSILIKDMSINIQKVKQIQVKWYENLTVKLLQSKQTRKHVVNLKNKKREAQQHTCRPL